MNNGCKLGLGVAFAALICVPPAFAHHSAAMFDRTRMVSVSGTVKEFQWTNPHSWLHVVAPGPNGGATTDWSIEMTSPNLMQRGGWRPSTLKPGDRVTVMMAPMRDGTNAGQFRSITLADGRVLTERGPGAATPPAGGAPAGAPAAPAG